LAIVKVRPYIISGLAVALAAFTSQTIGSQILNVEQTASGSKPAAELVESFDGLGAGLAAGNPPRNPSDNSLAVGPDHIMQTVNSQIVVFTKKGKRFDTTGKVLYGPIATNTAFAGFGGVCEARPNGDAVVRYDQLAGRWLIVMPIFRRAVERSDGGQTGVRLGSDPKSGVRLGSDPKSSTTSTRSSTRRPFVASSKSNRCRSYGRSCAAPRPSASKSA
jgi:hypothetical protein